MPFERARNLFGGRSFRPQPRGRIAWRSGEAPAFRGCTRSLESFNTCSSVRIPWSTQHRWRPGQDL